MVVAWKGAGAIERVTERRQLLLSEQRPGGADALRRVRELARFPRRGLSDSQLHCVQHQ